LEGSVLGNPVDIFPGLHEVKDRRPVRVLGIDLGTTNSVVADLKWDPGQPDEIEASCIEIPQETLEGCYRHWLVPSVVAIYGGRVFVGEGGKRLRSGLQRFGLEQDRDIFYECKNDMGVRRTYHKAPEGFRSAREIAGRILSYLYECALDRDPTPVDRVVVTVPASFQAAQRQDTLEAARMAGLDLQGGDLLDEPVAAFLDYLIGNAGTPLLEAGESKNVLIFDFGGGTCDVAVFRISLPEERHALDIASLSVSRYHRLGGGDIDRAIIYKYLIPQMMEQNGIPRFSLNFTDKKNWLEPALLGVAESLKIKMSREIDRLQKFGRYQGTDPDQIAVKQPGIVNCSTKTHEFDFNSPTLTARQFEEALAPFLDQDLLYFREDEYHLTCSIFAPLQDALERSGLRPLDVDICWLVGAA
jgi:molecular chaperone DnaK (HSP70)